MSRSKCSDTWLRILNEYEPHFDKIFNDESGKIYNFVGIVHGSDDYYYVMSDSKGFTVLASCVGSLDQMGFTLAQHEEVEK